MSDTPRPSPRPSAPAPDPGGGRGPAGLPAAPIGRLHVFYDGECGLCSHCRDWLRGQPAWVPLVFTAFQTPEAERLCPGLADFHPEREIVVMADNGDVYQGADAWIMCLWALRDYRALSFRLAGPTLKPLARKAVLLVSNHRLRLSRLLGQRGDEGLMRAVVTEETPRDGCEGGSCRL